MTRLLNRQSGRSIQKGISLLLVLMMMLSLLPPVQVFALEGEPDLTVKDIHVPEGVKAGEQSSVTAAVYNDGSIAAGAFTAALYLEDETTPCDEQTVTSLAPGETQNVDFAWTPAAEGAYTLRVVADSKNEISETDKNNNEKSISVNVLAATSGTNHIPVRKAGVAASITAQIPVGRAYTLDLATIFEDADAGDTLMYKVKINDAAAVAAEVDYTYTPAQAGEDTLIFTANDGTADSEDTYTVALTATATAPALTVRLDGQELSGDSLESIITGSGKDRFQIEIFEFTAGKFTPADWTYLQGSYNNRSNRTEPASIVFTANVDTIGPGCAFANGFSTSNNSSRNVIRFECNGIETLGGSLPASNAKGLPVAFWFPDLKNLYNGRVFNDAAVDALYLPKLETIGTSSFYNCKAKYLILTGDAPTVTTVDMTGAAFTTWVPEDKLSSYTTTLDPNSGGKLWLGRPIKTFPSELTDLHKLVSYVINQIPEHSEAFTLEDLDRILFAQYLAYILPLGNGLTAQDATALSAAQSKLIDALADKIGELPAQGDLTAADGDNILKILSIYGNFNPQQKQLFDQSYATIFDELLRKYAAVIALAHPTAQMVLYAPEKGVGWGSSLAEVIQSMGVTTTTARNEVKTMYVLKGSFPGTSLLDLKGTNTFSNLTSLITTGEVDINGGMITPRMFGTTAKTFTLLALPSVTEIQSQGLYKINAAFQAPTVERIGESIFQDAGTAKLDPFLPRLVSGESKLPADSPLIMPRLQSGKNVYDSSGERYIFLPALENAGVNFFKNTTALQAAWLPKLKTINGATFAGSAIQELYLQADPPEVTGAAPFSGLSSNRVVYVPADLLEAYATVADDDAQDGKWYGWEVRSISASTTAAALLNAYIELLPENVAINIDHSEWLRSIESARNSLSDEEKSKVDSRLDRAISAVEPYEKNNAQNVIDLIEALKPVAELTLEDRAVVCGARAAYVRLTAGAKNAVTNYSELIAAEEHINGLALADVKEKIANLPTPVTIENKGVVRTAYSAYLELPESVKGQITQPEKQKLQTAVEEVVALETTGLSAKIVDDKIAALPAPADITLSDESAVKSARAAYNSLSAAAQAGVTKLDILIAAEAKIAELKNIKPEGVKTIYLSVEKFTLGQGYVKTPVAVTAQAGDNAATLLTRVLGSGNYTNSGAPDSGFYLQSVKDNDSTPANIPAYILQRIAMAGSEVGARQANNWLGEFDYTNMSGWMFTVNNGLPSAPEGGLLGASDFTYEMMADGDVIRWQFTVYGYGADLGLESMFGDAYIDTADKGALTAKIADIDASADKAAWMAHTDYAEAYREALRVLQDMESSQAAVDASLAAISHTPTTDAPIGTVTVTVRDTAPRRQVTTTTIGLPVAFRSLSGLGSYQKPFGVLLDKVEVPLTVGMTAQQAVKAALAGRGYATFDSNGAITGVGPVTTPDKSATVEHLSNGDAGDRSKWVLSRNQVAIFDSAQPVYPKDGDDLFLDYSVDGGYDVQCYSYAHTYFDVSFSTATRVSGTNNAFTFIVPESTQTLAIRYGVKGSDDQPNAYNRYKTLTISSKSIVYDQGEEIPIVDGQLIEVKVGLDGGGATHNPFSPTSTITTINPGAAIMRCTVVIYPVLADLIGDIQALPAFEDLNYDVDYSQVMDLMRRYNLLTAADKALIPAAETAKLNAAYAEMTRIYNEDYAAWLAVYTPLSSLSSTLNQENYLLLQSQVEELRQAFNNLTPRQQAMNNGVLSTFFTEIDNKITEYTEMANFQAPLGTATNYRNDFMLTGYGFNIDVCSNFEQDLAAKKLTEVVFFDTPRISQDNSATNNPLLVIDVKDPEILEVRKVSSPNPNSPSQMLDHYYLVGKQAGTTTFTVRYPGFMGQTPETIVHVNGPEESGDPDLANALTNINEIARKYDTWHYLEGTPGAEFTFKVTGSNAQVKVLDYLHDTYKTYSPDHEGNVTVLLTDGYNPILVTADLDGKTVTQAYGVRGKAVKYTLTNATNPGSSTFKAGDTARLEILGLNTPIYKISRIYNPATTNYVFDTDMPRYTFLQSGGGQYAATTLEFELTAAGEFNLTNGRVTQSWFGSGLYAELPVGTAPPVLNAGQPNGVFSSLPDLQITAEENPAYQPELFHPEIEGGTTVQPGATVKLKIPDLDVDYINDKHTTTGSTIVDILEAYTIFKTDIPGLKSVKSAKASTANYNITNLKEVTFTVPEDTAPGQYHIGGGYVDVTSGPTWWMIYTVYYAGRIADLTIQVGEDSQAPQFAAGYPQTANVGPTGFDLKVKLNEAGTAYYKVVADSSDPGSDYQAWTAVSVAGGDEVAAATVSGLAPEEAYDVYVIAKDTAGNWQSQPVKLDIMLPAEDKPATMLAQAKAYYDITKNKALNSWWDLGAVLGGYGSLNGYTLPDYSGEYSGRQPTDYAGRILGELAVGGNPYRTQSGQNLVAALTAFDNDGDGRFSTLTNQQTWAIIALNAAKAEAADGYYKEEALQVLLNMQRSDGSFDQSLPDYTGMALLALSSSQEIPGVNDAITKAVAQLQTIQNKTGDYAGGWLNNSNTIATVISGLAAVGEDVRAAEWTVSGRNPLDALSLFQTESGFKYLTNQTSVNDMASYQSIIALGDALARDSVWNRLPFGREAVVNSATTTSSGKKIFITFNKALADPAGQEAQFTLKVDGVAGPDNGVMGVALHKENRNVIELTLTKLIKYGQSVSVEYTKGSLTAADGGVVETFAQPVVNTVPEPLQGTTADINSGSANKNVNITADTVTQAGGSPIHVTVAGGVEEAAIIVAELLAPAQGDTVSVPSMPAVNISAATEISQDPVEVAIPAGTVITASADWDGTIHVPEARAKDSVTVPAEEGKTTQVEAVIEIGYGDIPLTFNKAVRILLPGQAGKKAGYTRGGVFTPITTVLAADNQAAADALPDGGDGYVNVGSDLVIWTKHFTRFVSYTQKDASNPGGGGETDPADSITVHMRIEGYKGTHADGEIRFNPQDYYKQSSGKYEITDPDGKSHSWSEPTVMLATVVAWNKKNIKDNIIRDSDNYIARMAGEEEFDFAAISHGGEDTKDEDHNSCGWMVRVNDYMINQGAGVWPIENGDEVVWYYGDLESHYGYIDVSPTSLDPGESITVKVTGKENNIGTAGKAQKITDATVYVGSKEYLTDKNGEVEITLDNPGTYKVYAEKVDKNAKNGKYYFPLLSRTEKVEVTVEGSGGAGGGGTTGGNKVEEAKSSLAQAGAITLGKDQITVDQDKTSALVKAQDLSQALRGIEAEIAALKAGGTLTAEEIAALKKQVTLTVPENGTGTVEVVLEANATSLLKQANSLKIISEVANLEIPAASLGTALGKEITFTARKIAYDSLEEKAQSQVPAGSVVVDLTLRAGSSTVKNFAEPVRVEIPYEGSGQNGDRITVFLLKEDGTIEPVGGIYEAASGRVKFFTDHFSTYFAQESVKQFTDLAKYPWAKDAVEIMAGKGIIGGKGEGIFDPGAPITRAEFAALITRMLHYRSEAKVPFSDVKTGQWYYADVAAAYGKGLISGKSAQTFDPAGQITRQEMAAIIAKVLQKNGSVSGKASVLDSFKDQEKIASWAGTAVAITVEEGIITGMGDGSFAPEQKATRAQAAVMLYRLYKAVLE